MFRAIPCSSSGGEIVLLQHLVSSLSLSSYSVRRLRADCICRQTPTTHMISTIETLYVISIKYKLSLPDDGSYTIRNTLEYILMYVF